MSVTLQQLEQAELPELATTLRNAGVSGAGGAGMPSYAKWDRLDEVDHLLVNHQESEPNYYIDKWLGRERADEFATLFDALLGRAFETVVVGAKAKDRNEWMREFERATDATVYLPDQLPIDSDEESGVVFVYTDDKYEYGMESVLLRMVGDVVIGQDLPMDHGWLVQNTETLHNVFRAFKGGKPTTHKYLHVGGNVPRHRFLEVPVGTPAAEVLEAAGRPIEDLDGEILADGGPGWCFEIPTPDEFGVTKRTNCLTVVDSEVAEENTLGSEGRINVLSEYDWDRDHETAPTETLRPETVRIPLVTNPAFESVVAPSEPIVSPGESVSVGEMIATPSSEAISNTQHASIDGEVAEVTDSYVEIRRESESTTAAGVRTAADVDTPIYWTWCRECGDYVPMIDWEGSNPTEYVCHNCR